MGQPTGWTWAFSNVYGASGPDLVATRSYDTAGRLTQVTAGGQTLLQYAYDAAGRVYSLTQQVAQPDNPGDPNTTVSTAPVTWSVGYDPAGRIVSFDTTGNTASFNYDANGNRLTSSQTAGGQTTSRSYTVASGANVLTGFSQAIGSTTTNVSYAYNANGDLLNDGLHSFSYNAEGRLSDATTGATDTSPTTRYAYNALGQRVFKTEPQYPPAAGDEGDPSFMQSLIDFFTKLWAPAVTDAEKLGYVYMYDEAGTLQGEFGTGGANSSGKTEYVWLPTANGPLPVAVVMNGTTALAVQADQLNTPRLLTAYDGSPQWQWAYSAFGDAQPTLAVRKFATVAPAAGDPEFNLRYPGQYADKESGLNYNYFRSYSPTTGRYTQADPIGLDGGWNRFGYVRADALRYADPKGLQTQVLGPVVPVLGIGCALTKGCREAVADALQSCGQAVDNLKDWIFSRAPSKETRGKADEQATDDQGRLRCQYCGDELIAEPGSPNSREFDHETPWSRGGESEIDNILDACRTCNRQKGNRLFPDEWQPRK